MHGQGLAVLCSLFVAEVDSHRIGGELMTSIYTDPAVAAVS